jgi:hypothetical protein
MRNILEKVRKRDYDEVKQDAQRIYLAHGRRQAEAEFRRFRKRRREAYPAMVRQLERDLPELLSFFSLPRHLWRKLRTTDEIDKPFLSDISLFLRNRFWRPCQFSGWLRRAGLFPAGKDPSIGFLGLFGHGPFLVAN